MTSGKLYFEVVRDKKHYFFMAHESSKAAELKKMVEGVTEIPFDEQKLLMLTKDQTEDFQEIDYDKSFKENGYDGTNAESYAPARLALLMKNEDKPIIAELSVPEPQEAANKEQ